MKRMLKILNQQKPPKKLHFNIRHPQVLANLLKTFLRDKKKRRLERIYKSLSPEESSAATSRGLKQSGNVDISKIIDHLLNHPEDIDKVNQCIQNNKIDKLMSPSKALALMTSLKLSKLQYITLRDTASDQGVNLYPSYYAIQQAKEECYPSKENMVITENGARIQLQALLDLTAKRLLKAIGGEFEGQTLKLQSKWGFDGASGQSNYKMRSENVFDESSIFMASLVPLKLTCDGEAIWDNDKPSSTHLCRPILFQFVKETQVTVINQESEIKAEINALNCTEIVESNTKVEHELHMTMIDGKISSYLSGTSTASCDICHAKPTEVNKLEKLSSKVIHEEVYQYGLSSLHAWIRCMEYILHIGIVNRGDSFRRRRSRSGSLAPSPAAAPEPAERRVVALHRVAMVGAPGVGKTALISQFQTSECINAYDRQRDAEAEQKVSIMLNSEESELYFVNCTGVKEEIERSEPPDAFVVIYSVVDKASFLKAEQELTKLVNSDMLRARPAVLVGNKIDLARSRAVSTQDGKCLACTYRAKFVEVSVGINHNVDELLVGILNQIRLKQQQYSADGGRESSPAHWYKSRGVVRASMKARQMFTWIFGKEDSKFKNCENFNVL